MQISGSYEGSLVTLDNREGRRTLNTRNVSRINTQKGLDLGRVKTLESQDPRLGESERLGFQDLQESQSEARESGV
jgi:hypothetical protein